MSGARTQQQSENLEQLRCDRDKLNNMLRVEVSMLPPVIHSERDTNYPAHPFRVKIS